MSLTNKKILVLGANGRTGKHIVNQLQKNNYEYIAGVVRSKQKAIEASIDTITLEIGDCTDDQFLEEVILKYDVVINALGSRSLKSHEFAMHSSVMKNLKEGSVYVYMSSVGVAESFKKLPLFFKFMFRVFLRSIFKDKELIEKDLKQKGINYIIVRPAGLTDSEDEIAFTIEEAPTDTSLPKTSRLNVAKAIIKLLEDPNNYKKTFEVFDDA